MTLCTAVEETPQSGTTVGEPRANNKVGGRVSGGRIRWVFAFPDKKSLPSRIQTVNTSLLPAKYTSPNVLLSAIEMKWMGWLHRAHGSVDVVLVTTSQCGKVWLGRRPMFKFDKSVVWQRHVCIRSHDVDSEALRFSSTTCGRSEALLRRDLLSNLNIILSFRDARSASRIDNAFYAVGMTGNVIRMACLWTATRMLRSRGREVEGRPVNPMEASDIGFSESPFNLIMNCSLSKCDAGSDDRSFSVHMYGFLAPPDKKATWTLPSCMEVKHLRVCCYPSVEIAQARLWAGSYFNELMTCYTYLQCSSNSEAS